MTNAASKPPVASNNLRGIARHAPEAQAVSRDARAGLANLGFAAATGRYLALLDYDDVLSRKPTGC
jgi:hypothetical protein